MATSGIALGAQQTPPILVQPDFVPGPQANATPAQDAGLQDVVTLAGRTAENGQTQTANDSTQFGETAAFFFAERHSFRAANGSGGSQTAQAPSVPELPVKLTSSVPNPQSSRTPSAANDPAQGAAKSVAANQVRSTLSAASQSAPTVSNTPLAELAQLDHTLQQIGIDPQSISLFNRMAMLLYANDPAALKMLVQTLQSGAQQLATDPNTVAATTNQIQTGSAGRTLSSGQTSDAQLNGSEQGNRPAIQTDLAAQSVPESLQRSVAEVAQARVETASSGPESNRPERPTMPRTGPHHPSNLSLKMSDLKLTFAAIDPAQLDPPSQSAQTGQFLNITI